MKKFLSVILSLLLVCSVALAECACTTNPVVIGIAKHLCEPGIEMDADTLMALAEMVEGKSAECNCSAYKLAFIDLLITNTDTVYEMIGETRFGILIRWIAECHCCDVQTEVEEPSKPSHSHYGGTHENGGKCKGCGRTYQKHTIEWSSLNNSFHVEKCSCGWTGEQAKHKAGELIEACSNGLAHYKCTVCHADLYWYLMKKHNCNDCGCCFGTCCENCSCGCH